MPEAISVDLVAHCVLVCILGMKHGFDADHLATIDGLTRFNAPSNPRLARFCGVWFSLGHGAVVVAIALSASTFAQRWHIPQWLELSGAWISIGFLLVLGLANLHATLRARSGQVIRPVGLKGRLLGRLSGVSKPGLVALVGALFALSFDTISQASFFAMTAARFGGTYYALLFGLLFMCGMLLTDGINGLWISRLMRRADQVAVTASRIMSLAVAIVGLLVAGLGLLKLLIPDLSAWSEGRGLFFGTVVVVLIYGCFLFSIAGNRVRPQAAVDPST
jgi:high-affinity nickel-transport protein